MIRKILMVFSVLLIGSAFAQDGWAHELISPFAKPLDFLELPWDAHATPADMSACWQGEPVPFLGKEYTYYCFQRDLGDAIETAQHLQVAISDAGLGSYYVRTQELQNGGTFTSFTPSYILGDAVYAWVFNRLDEPTRISFAFRPAVPMSGPGPNPVVEPESEPVPVVP